MSLDQRMIFVVGAPRSGTNWMQRIIAAHPDVASMATESYLFSLGIAPLVERFHHAAVRSPELGTTYVQRSTLIESLRAFTDAIFLEQLELLDPTADRLVERTPDHANHLALIGEIYPDAHVVHIVRDGRDVARSLTSMEWGPDDLVTSARLWRDAVVAARRAGASLAHYHEFRWEDLLTDVDAAVRSIYTALALPVDDEIVRRGIAEAGHSYNADPLDPQVRTAKWQQSLTPEEVADIEREVGDTLDELGYDRAAPQPPAPEPPAARLRERRWTRRQPARTTTAFADGLQRELRANQEVMHAFLQAVHTANEPALRTLLADNVNIVIEDGSSSWRDRGAPAIDRFAAAVRGGSFGGRQIFGDVHPSVPSFTALLAYERDGARRDVVISCSMQNGRVVVVRVWTPPFGAITP